MSDLAKNLLSQYYGLGEKSHNKRFLSVHECIENVKTDEQEFTLERKSTITNEQNFSEEKYSQKDISDCDNLTFINDVAEKSSGINETDDENDTIGEIDDYDFSRSIINNEFEISQTSLHNVSPNTAKTISRLLETENIEGNDLSISNYEDSIPDNISEISSANILKTPKKLAEKRVLKEPVLNEIFADFSNVGLSIFSMEVLDQFSEIRMLYLESNNLTELPDELFPTLRHLEWLDVRNNQLITIPINIKHHLTLATILLDGNRIEKLPLELCLLPKLKTLHVTQNPLIAPPQDIVNLGYKGILNFLRNEWNKLHPEQMVKFEEKTIEAKPSTILCYNSPRKNKKRPRTVQSMSAETVSVRQKIKLYRPSNRYNMDNNSSLISKSKEILDLSEDTLHKPLCDLCIKQFSNMKCSEQFDKNSNSNCNAVFDTSNRKDEGEKSDQLCDTNYRQSYVRKDIKYVNDKILRLSGPSPRSLYIRKNGANLRTYNKISDRYCQYMSPDNILKYIEVEKNMIPIKGDQKRTNTDIEEKAFDIVTKDRKRLLLCPMRLQNPDWMLACLENYIKACVSAGADISKEQYLLWISKAKEALYKQESLLQQIKDENSLKGWRRDKRSIGKSMEKAKNRNEADIPFAINFEEFASILKRNPNSENRNNTGKKTQTEFIPPSNINKKFGELLDTLNKLCTSKSDTELTPRTKQKVLKQEIEKILQFQEDIQNLKKYNHAVIAPFARRM